MFDHPHIKHPMTLDEMVSKLGAKDYTHIDGPKNLDDLAKLDDMKGLADKLRAANYFGTGDPNTYLPHKYTEPKMPGIKFTDVFGAMTNDVLRPIRKKHRKEVTVQDTDDKGNVIKDKDGKAKTTTKFVDGDKIAPVVAKTQESLKAIVFCRQEDVAPSRVTALENYFKKAGAPKATIHTKSVKNPWTGNKVADLDVEKTIAANPDLKGRFHELIRDWVRKEMSAAALRDDTLMGKKKETKALVSHQGALLAAKKMYNEAVADTHLC